MLNGIILAVLAIVFKTTENMYNLLITGFRYLLRHPLYAFINLAGLSIGMASAILILVYVAHETSYDTQHKDDHAVVRLVQGQWGAHSPSLKYDLDALSFVEQSARVDFMFGNRMSVRYEHKLLNINDIIFTDPEIFNIMQYEFVAGNPEEALKNPFSMVLTASTANAIFGDESPIGKVIRVDNKHLYTISAVIRDVQHSHISFNGMAIFEDLPVITGNPDFLKRTDNWNYNYYLRLSDGTSIGEATTNINAYLQGKQNWVDGRQPAYRLQIIDEVYFDRSVKHELGIAHGNRTMVRVFMGVALVILLLAVINFINITTANATNRAKETGVRKVVGSSKSKLVVQYLSEAVLLSFAAMAMALLLVELSLPVLQNILQKELVIRFFDPQTLLLLTGAALLTGLLAGLMPAWVLSAFRPVEVLKGFSNRPGGKGHLRAALTVFQFVISIALISATVFAYQQVTYMNSKSLGINIENMIYARISPDIRNAKSAFRESLLQHPGIVQVAYTNAIPGHITWQESFTIDGESRQYTFMPTTVDFLEMIDLQVSEGRNFSRSPADKEGSIIVNPAAVDYFGWPKPLGHTEQAPYRGPLTVIGITDNFHFNDVTKPITPLVIYLSEDVAFHVCLRIDEQNQGEALAHFESTWLQYSPEFPLEYGFVKDAFTNFYKEQQVQLRIFVFFSLLSIFIAALGVYGMAAFTANRKRREVCIRKIHGAGLGSIYLLLSAEMLKLLAIAFVIASLLAWYFVNQWLQGFPYHIATEWWVFVAAGIFSLLISQLTITGQVVRVARVNPAEALRYE